MTEEGAGSRLVVSSAKKKRILERQLSPDIVDEGPVPLGEPLGAQDPFSHLAGGCVSVAGAGSSGNSGGGGGGGGGDGKQTLLSQFFPHATVPAPAGAGSGAGAAQSGQPAAGGGNIRGDTIPQKI